MTATGTADGVPLTIELVVVDQAAGCAPLAGAAVYVWHCDREGLYSLYSEGVDRRELPARRPGDRRRRTGALHEHLPGVLLGALAARPLRGVREPRRGRRAAKRASPRHSLRFPDDVCELVYATDGYAQSVENLSQVSLESDNVFGDGAELQLATVTGSVEDGLVAALQLGV